jgi:hypothetical protein
MRIFPVTACLTLLALSVAASQVLAGNAYQITSSDGSKSITYEVKFGGAKLYEQWTAFDPATKKFVYLTWKRDTPAPEPAARIWDYHTGEIVPLYKFPGVEQPLPIIPSIADLKVCPLTGDKHPKIEETRIYD